jgi:hypothetical protein
MAIKQPDDENRQSRAPAPRGAGPDSGLVQPSGGQPGAASLFNARARGDIPVLEVPLAPATIRDIPEDDRSPIPGMSKQDYMNYLERAVSGDDDLPPPFLTYLNAQADARAEREKERKEFAFELLLEETRRRIEKNIADLEASAARWDAEAERQRQNMVDIERRMNSCQKVIDQIDAIFQKENKTGRIDREEALRLLRQRGVKVGDSASDKELHDLLLKEKQRQYLEKLRLSGEYDAAEHAREEAERRAAEDRARAKQLADNLKANEQAALQPGLSDGERSEIAKREQELLENSDKWALRQNLERSSEVSSTQKEAIESAVRKQLENVTQVKVYGDPMAGM